MFLYVFSVCCNQTESVQCSLTSPVHGMRKYTMPREFLSVWTFDKKMKKWKIKEWNLYCCHALWMPGLACMPMFIQMIRASPFDTCNGNQEKFHSSPPVENQLRFNSWTWVEHELNVSWTRVETQLNFNSWSSTELQQLKFNWASTVERELICMWNFQLPFNSRSTLIFAYSWSSTELQQLSFNSWTRAYLHVKFSTAVQLAFNSQVFI